MKSKNFTSESRKQKFTFYSLKESKSIDILNYYTNFGSIYRSL